MYLNCKVKIPMETTGISLKRIKGVSYIYYTYDRTYDASRKYTKPVCTSIGKISEDDPDMMYPNTNFPKFFPEVDLPEEIADSERCGCLRIGTYIVIRQIISEYHLDELLREIIGKDSGLFLDLVAYSIVSEHNAGQYYPDYAYAHPLFTQGMKIYSDSKVSSFIRSITGDQAISFQNAWNDKQDHRQRIYISYDSTNKNCQAGDIDIVEFGHPKDNIGAPILNYAIAYDCNNSVPLFYEDYPGSIVDVSQVQYTLEKAQGYGYKNIGFIFDRGYFSEPNIHYMDKCGYEFIIMMKGMKDFVKDLVLQVKGSFEDHRECFIRDYETSGITVKKRMFPSDKKDRYFHIYYSDKKKSCERSKIDAKINTLLDSLKKHEGKSFSPTSSCLKYFDLVFSNPGTSQQKFAYARERFDVIDYEIQFCGYYVIISSEKMSADDALHLYKGRDASEKLFRGDKSYLGNKSLRVHTSEAIHAKIFISFVALIVRNRMHLCLKEEISKVGKKSNYMNVAAAIRELEKIDILRQGDHYYRLDHAITATQKAILSAFNMDDSDIKKHAASLSKDLIVADRHEKC